MRRLHLWSAPLQQAPDWFWANGRQHKIEREKAIPELLATLALEGCIVTIDAMGTQANIAQAIRDRGADYVLAVKDNQPTLAESLRELLCSVQGSAATDAAHASRDR
jgi:predicted transposase YbfD/YdcC